RHTRSKRDWSSDVCSSDLMLANITREKQLRDAVMGYNDECRWGQIDLAGQRVEPSFREEFMLAHDKWGDEIQIADSEIVMVKVEIGRASCREREWRRGAGE